MEIERAKRDTTSLRNWKADIGRLVATGVLTVVALAIAGWPDGAGAAWITLGVAVAAFVLVVAAEFAWNLALAPTRIALEQCERQREQERALIERQLLIANRTIAMQEVDIEVWGGAFNEAAGGKPPLSLAAILARRDVMLKARNIDKPLPPE
jgi:hypothetical protein